MKRVGIVGLGDMGIGLAKNLLKNGFELTGFDLREDRRHIKDMDVRNLRKKVKSRFNLEMSISPDIVKIAKKILPHQATLVPEKRQELTTGPEP